ncbi:Putative phosphoserine phosphatase 2 [Jannaschia seosinensis]|uniref:Putative phosphoserine phosphatase 2 n=1 Tax=Jannaschia seosinensis TaxID=313367 RepID=A0A0M7BGA8_9RHOB|nr:histidine phosphatase family protein [Jannaschia seosinensis]CUH40812.1 Putative phosphoserine phosphatase 2 [Jannaschia seosinensis]
MPPLYILRHGETEWNRAGRLQGTRDSDLTSEGRRQAARQGTILQSLPPICLARTSPQGRAAETARLAGLRAQADARLAEIALGTWEGQHLADLAPPRGIGWKFTAPGGETRARVEARLRALLDDLDGPTILVTHGVTSICLRGLLLGEPDLDKLTDPQGTVHRILDGRETVFR